MIRRKLKNVIKNYTECEVLVREATSNEAWGPSNSILSKIAELSNNEPNIIQIMPLIWKRLKDKGRKWRHVYKSLLLLNFLVTRGNILIAEYVRRNIHFIQSLESFTYTEDNVDFGSRIRKRAGELILLLKDNDFLKSERQKALLTDMRFNKDVVSQGSNVPIKYGNGVGTLSQGPSTGSFISSNDNKDVVIKGDYPVPATSVEEDIQLQIALAESKEEAERLKKTDEIEQLTDKYKLNLAIEKNLKENYFESDFDGGLWKDEETAIKETENDPWSPEPEKKIMVTEDPWLENVASNESLWSHNAKAPALDPWSANDGMKDDSYWVNSEAPWSTTTTTDCNPWPNVSPHSEVAESASVSYNPWSHNNQISSNPTTRKVPTTQRDGSVTKFLADHSHLVNFDSLVSPEGQRKQYTQNNPFLTESSHNECRNPFLAEERTTTTVNHIWNTDPRTVSLSPTSNDISSADLQSQFRIPHYNPFLT